MSFNKGAWNKVLEVHPEFIKIINPLKNHLKIDFGYMKIFDDGKYFQIIENLECLHKWVNEVEESHIFCAKDSPKSLSGEFKIRFWPEKPACKAMQIYKEYGIWNGITFSKIEKNFTELYWFTRGNADHTWQKWFTRNMSTLSEFVDYFENNKKDRIFSFANEKPLLFEFKTGFNSKLAL